MNPLRRVTHAKTIFMGLIALMMAACNPLSQQPAVQQPVSLTAEVPSTGGQSGAPAVTVMNQEYDGTTVVVADVVSNGPGWMVIHNDENGSLGPPIGFTQVKSGDNKNVKVTIDPAKASPTLYAMLHADAGEVGKYEFPGPDVPVVLDGQMLSPPFQAIKSHSGGVTITPAVIIQNQVVKDGKVVIQEVDTNGPGWVAVHIQGPDGNPGTDIGYTAVKSGQNKNIVVTVDPTRITPVMYAMLHTDAGEVGTYEFPGPDAPQTVNNVMVAPAFSTDGKALANPGAAAAPTAMGNMAMQATATPAPTQPAAPVATATAPVATATADMGMVMATPTAGSDASPTQPPAAGEITPDIKVADQPIKDSSVIIPEVISSGDAWLVIHRQNGDGTMGPMVGYAHVNKGTNINVVVKVDTSLTSTTLFAMLHQDLGTKGKLEFPGPDEPVMVNGQMISPPFLITYNNAADVIINVSQSTANGAHLVDGQGRSLYIFLKDKPGVSNCTGDCLTIWPPFVTNGRIIAGSGVATNKLGVLITSDGSRQVTYGGVPLYTYSKDLKPGDINGQGFEGAWFLVSP